MQPKCLNIVSHMFLQPTYRAGRKCNLGQFITNIWTGERELLYREGRLLDGP